MQSKYYQEHKEEILAKAKKYYQKNKEDIKARSKKYYDEHKEELKERGYSHDYYEAHKEELRARARKYTKDHADKIRAYKKANREKILADQARWREKRRLEKGLDPTPKRYRTKNSVPEVQDEETILTAEQKEFMRKNREKALTMLGRRRR